MEGERGVLVSLKQVSPPEIMVELWLTKDVFLFFPSCGWHKGGGGASISFPYQNTVTLLIPRKNFKSQLTPDPPSCETPPVCDFCSLVCSTRAGADANIRCEFLFLRKRLLLLQIVFGSTCISLPGDATGIGSSNIRLIRSTCYEDNKPPPG